MTRGQIEPSRTGARRRRVAVAGLLAVAVGTTVAFTAAQAFATAGAGPPVSVYTARGPVSQSVVIGTPKSATATKVVTVRVKGKVVKRKVSFTYQTVTPMMTCGSVHRMRYGVPAADDPARRVHRLAYASGADVRRGRAGRGNPLPRDVGLPVVQVRDRGRLHAALDRGAQHEERGLDAAGLCGRSMHFLRGRQTRRSASISRSLRSARTFRNSMGVRCRSGAWAALLLQPRSACARIRLTLPASPVR